MSTCDDKKREKYKKSFPWTSYLTLIFMKTAESSGVSKWSKDFLVSRSKNLNHLKNCKIAFCLLSYDVVAKCESRNNNLHTIILRYLQVFFVHRFQLFLTSFHQSIAGKDFTWDRGLSEIRFQGRRLRDCIENRYPALLISLFAQEQYGDHCGSLYACNQL